VARLSSVRTALVMIYRIDPLPDDLISSGYAIIRPDGSCATCDNIAKLQS
jgi:hypothetical protein